MTSHLRRVLAVAGLTLLFNYFFWSEKMGVNTLLFTPVLMGVLYGLYPSARRHPAFIATVLGALLSAVMVTWHNSGAAKFALWVSATSAVGFAQASDFRFLLYAQVQYWHSVLFSLGATLQALRRAAPSSAAAPQRSFRKKTGFGWVPFVVLGFFYLLYYAANEKFANASDVFWREVFNLLSFDISLPHLVFIGFSLLLCGGAVWARFTPFEREEGDDLVRIRRPYDRQAMLRPIFPITGLATEFTQTRTLLWMLNVLLLAVNVMDIRYVWFQFDDTTQKDLKSYVHEGTYLLIFSILLAMGVLFFAFRKNLNFYPDRQSLVRASGVWLLQNAILAISVGVRTWRYIDFHGLAYKRIGVFLFLMLVFFGLWTLWEKIRDRKRSFWLIERSAWAFFVLMLLNACVSWDTWITRYNLSGRPRGTVDVHYMIFTLSDKNIAILEAEQAKLDTIHDYPPMDASWIDSSIRSKRANFEAEQQRYSWKSWNWADAQATRAPN